MNIAEFSIRNKVVTWVVTIVLLGVGAISFQNLSRLEDPEFTIKDAIVFTPYPGASATEVEEEVTNDIEKAAQQMGQLEARAVAVLARDVLRPGHDEGQVRQESLPQVWDELRRKVGDAASSCPPAPVRRSSTTTSATSTASSCDLPATATATRSSTSTPSCCSASCCRCRTSSEIAIYADRKEVIYVETRRAKMAELGISPDEILRRCRQESGLARRRRCRDRACIALNPTGSSPRESSATC